MTNCPPRIGATRRWSTVTVLIQAVVAGAALGACTARSTTVPDTPAPDIVTSSAVPTGSSTSPTTGTTGPPSATSGPSNPSATTTPSGSVGPLTQCRTADLGVSAAVVPGSAGMNHYSVSISVVNRAGTSCLLSGYPGVSLVSSAAGNPQIGRAAERSGGAATSITLRPGDAASASLRMTNPDPFPECTSTPAAGLRVYVPGATDSTVIPFPPGSLRGCGGSTTVSLMTVAPFVAG